jgi:quinol monooxygenase YgiN
MQASPDTPVVIIAKIHPKPGRQSELLAIMSAHATKFHAEPGCERYALHVMPDAIVIIEKWQSGDHLRAHADGKALQEMRAQMAELVSERPSVMRTIPHPAGEWAQGVI